MLQSEFEALTKQQVSPNEYHNIEVIYNECPTINKQDFCKAYMKYRNNQFFIELMQAVLKRNNDCIKAQEAYHEVSKQIEAQKELYQQQRTAIKGTFNSVLASVKDKGRVNTIALATKLLTSSPEAMEEILVTELGRNTIISIKLANNIEL